MGLRFCARAFSSCGKRGPLFIAVHTPLTVMASLFAEHKLQTRRLSSCGSRAQLLHGMWDLPRPGLEPVSPALAGRFSTTAPPGKPLKSVFIFVLFSVLLRLFKVLDVADNPQKSHVFEQNCFTICKNSWSTSLQACVLLQKNRDVC